jgi:hypothetical protein
MRTWSRREDRTIRRLAATHTAKQLAELLPGRTVNAIHQRAYRLKVRLQKAGDRDYRTKDSDALVERVRQLHEQGKAPSAISRETGVPIGSVKSFAYYRARAQASLVQLEQAAA